MRPIRIGMRWATLPSCARTIRSTRVWAPGGRLPVSQRSTWHLVPEASTQLEPLGTRRGPKSQRTIRGAVCASEYHMSRKGPGHARRFAIRTLGVRCDAVFHLCAARLVLPAWRVSVHCDASVLRVVVSVNSSDSRGMLVTNGRISQPNPTGISRVSVMDSHCTCTAVALQKTPVRIQPPEIPAILADGLLALARCIRILHFRDPSAVDAARARSRPSRLKRASCSLFTTTVMTFFWKKRR